MVTVGIIRGVRGLKGQMRVESLSDFPSRFVRGQCLELDGMERVIEKVLDEQKGLLIELEGINSRECAEKYRGHELKIYPNQSEQYLDENSYFHHEIIGMTVVDQSDIKLGTINEIIETGANDVYVVTNSIDKDILVPAIRSVVRSVCVISNTMNVDLPRGLNTRI